MAATESLDGFFSALLAQRSGAAAGSPELVCAWRQCEAAHARVCQELAQGSMLAVAEARAYLWRFRKAARLVALEEAVLDGLSARVLVPDPWGPEERRELLATAKWLAFVRDDGREFLCFRGDGERFYIDEDAGPSGRWVVFPRDWYYRGSFKFLGGGGKDWIPAGATFALWRSKDGTRMLVCCETDGSWFYCDWSGEESQWVPFAPEDMALGGLVLENLSEEAAATASRFQTSSEPPAGSGSLGITPAHQYASASTSTSAPTSSSSSEPPASPSASHNGYRLWRRREDGVVFTTVLVAEAESLVRYYCGPDSEWVPFPPEWESLGTFEGLEVDDSLEPIYGTFAHPSGELVITVLVRGGEVPRTYFLDEVEWAWRDIPASWNPFEVHPLVFPKPKGLPAAPVLYAEAA